MKKFITSILLPLALLIGSLPPAALADSQGLPQTFISATNLPVWPQLSLTNGSSVIFQQQNTGTNYIPVRINSGLAMQFTFAVPLSGAWTNGPGLETNALGNAQIWLWPSVDGTNAVTGPPWATLVGSPNYTNAVIISTNWTELQLRGYAGLFYSVSNGCTLPIIAGGPITNALAAQTNIYNGGLLFSRPNR